VVFEFFKCLQRLSIEINLFLPVNANISWLLMLASVPSSHQVRDSSGYSATYRVSARSAVAQVLKEILYRNQCSGSKCFLASWILIRIRIFFVRVRILPSTSKKLRKPLFLLFCDFFMNFYLCRMIKCTFKKEMSIKIFFVGILKVTDELSRIRIRIRIRW
jgi:hypothetical protein